MLVSRPNDTRYAYGNFEETQGARVGIRTGTADEENFQSWAQKHHPRWYRDVERLEAQKENSEGLK